MKLLLIEDDLKIARAVCRGLEAEGVTVDAVHDGDDGYWRASEGSYDLIILDIMLPSRNGFRICSDLRAEGNWTPILMLTAKDGDLDEAEGLDTGADDYLVKPFSFPVLVSRVRALVRRNALGAPPPMEVGPLRLDPGAHRVWRDDCEIVLTTREFEVLEFLVRRSGQVLSKSQIQVDLAHPENADLAATHRSVLDETELLQRLVENLLTLARIDSGPGRPTHPVDLDDIVLAETRRLRDHTSLRVDTSAVSAAQIDGDADSLTRVVRNLLDNAGRHAEAVVVVSLEQHAEQTILAVSDDGPGVPPEHHLDVFDRFTRLDQSRHSGDGGTGLGLAITRDIVQRHGGTIRVDADHSPGARFVVELAR